MRNRKVKNMLKVRARLGSTATRSRKTRAAYNSQDEVLYSIPADTPFCVSATSSPLLPPAAPHHDAVVKAGTLHQVGDGDTLVGAVYGVHILGGQEYWVEAVDSRGEVEVMSRVSVAHQDGCR